MIISIEHQVKLVVFSLASGIITGILFDIYRIIRGFENPNKVITYIQDILFWIMSSILVFIFLLYFNYAYVGFYVYLFIIVGIFFYLKLASNIFIKVLYNSINIIGKLLRVLKNTILFPIELLIYKIKNKKVK
ncbi:spore cortex biosynthesis protein YabQ [Clostridium sp. MSJ-11]|uniref:Spore cortex biosynthesis protein YabQ n=1 Tax=Clostridium mobile TaxID=2841512 RepID=A0ABS6EMK6_9CLOT|nr:spore cortex biosynthesis protein YabQ [Clostridium mobile]MBU5486268.1 spore cortex biosynthesis protein YabQ [Clostridium mobile]